MPEVTARFVEIQVPLKLVEGDFVALFMLAVGIRVLLNCIVGEVYEPAGIGHAKLLRGRPDIPLSVPPSLPTIPQHPYSDIKLPTLVKEGCDITLHNDGAVVDCCECLLK